MGHIAAQEPACTEEDRCPGHTHTRTLSLARSLFHPAEASWPAEVNPDHTARRRGSLGRERKGPQGGPAAQPNREEQILEDVN